MVDVPVYVPGRECWLDPRVEVRRSRIEGRGLVAVAPVPAGAVVEILGGVLATDRDVRLVIESTGAYVDTVSVDEDLNLILPAGSPLHFGNHSCDPTLWWVDPFTLVARVDIAAGVEITVDYGTLTDDPDFQMDCACGAASCRRLITGADWERPELQRLYGTHWVPGLRRRIDALDASGSA